MCGGVGYDLTASATAGSTGTAPPGATAVCRDGTYSYSLHHSGTCSHHGGVARWLDGSTSSSSAGSSSPLALGTSMTLARRTASRGCKRSPLPDRRCSPGGYYSRLTKPVICSPTFRTSTIRNVPTSEKYAVEREYGMVARPYGRTIEIDHIISLELGGSNDLANLFPEPGSGIAGYQVKDRLENRLHAMVCAGRMTLATARHGIAANWEKLYDRVFGTAP
jgi:Protein of unknown function (DUF3761)